MDKKKEIRDLPVALTEDEISAYSRELADTVADLDELEQRRKSVADDFKQQITGMESKQKVLARRISTREEMCKVECQWVYDWDAGNKHLARIDTGEIIKRELIQNHERQKSLMEEVSERAAEELKGVDGVKNTSFTMENGTPTVNIEMED